ncbi:unnamed protein product [Candida verbasci]|uniref:Zn(2)-C6 fungal-type domain-containing protein n=1 Tax=Candida verbasci TaxID=1227364 RepID=A0A9W4XGH8_9ASCO|nr:unnamed protein product [Candida verbasci]
MSDKPNKEKHVKPRKHVSSACLECRKRHFKCDGNQPTCENCTKRNKICTYVASHRGGSRKKGVSMKKNQMTVNDVNQGPEMPMFVAEIEDFGQKKNSEGSISTNEDIIDKIHQLPCARDHSVCQDSNCPGKSAVNYFDKRSDHPLNEHEQQMVESLRKKIKLENNMNNLDCLFSSKEPLYGVSSFQDLDVELHVHDRNNFMNESTFDKEEILRNYYETFHKSHPFLPSKQELFIYFSNLSIERELLPILKIIGDGKTSTIYAKNTELISDRITQCIEIVKNTGLLDLISIQVLLLTAITAHISSLHSLSKKLRQFCTYLIKTLQIDFIDSVDSVNILTPTTDSNELEVFHSPRLSHISKISIIESSRRVFWDLHFFDVIIGSADGKTISPVSKLLGSIKYPTSPSREEFDYKGRSEAAKLVTQAVEMNVQIINKKPYEMILTKLKAELSSWEMRLNNPQLFQAPSLIHKNGDINEGVHQSVILYNYAKIFAHRPFSYLWKINSPQLPKCSGETIKEKDLPTQLKSDSKTTIETRKTIEAANSIVELLIDTNASKVQERTPFVACALALSSLVHLSAYIWLETTLQIDSYNNLGLNRDDLDIYTEYIKLALSAIYPIAEHWQLSNKLAKHIRESLITIKPKLYSKLRDYLPHVDIEIDQQQQQTTSSLASSIDQSNSYQDTLDNQNQMLIDDQIDWNMGQNSPISPSGCDWIDKALLDLFDDANKRRAKQIRAPYRRYVYRSNNYAENSDDDEDKENEQEESLYTTNLNKFKQGVNLRSIYVLRNPNYKGKIWPLSKFEKIDVLKCAVLGFNPDYDQAKQIEHEEKDMMKFPAEIFVNIFKILHATGKLKPKLMRVCKLFYMIILPILYDSPYLKATNFFNFVGSISNNKSLGQYIHQLDLSYIIQTGKNAFVAKLLKTAGPNLESFVAPQTSFGFGPMMSLKNCFNLKILDLRLVSETLNLEELFKSIRNLTKLESLSFPRSSIEIHDYKSVNWPPKLTFLRISGGISDEFLYLSQFPQSITHLEFAHCPYISDSGLRQILSRIGNNLINLKIQYPMPGLRKDSLDQVFFYCPNLRVLEISVDYVSSSFFDEENLGFLDYPRPLRTLYINSSGMLGTSTRLDPIDLYIALTERLPLLKNVSCTAKLGWHPKSDAMEYIVNELDERNGGIYIGY